jgi:transposase-like protein
VEAQHRWRCARPHVVVVDGASCSPSSISPPTTRVHLKTTNPIESTFATVRLRAKVTKGPSSKASGLVMAYKLIEAAQDRCQAVNAAHLVALVRAGAVFEKKG